MKKNKKNQLIKSKQEIVDDSMSDVETAMDTKEPNTQVKGKE